MLTIRDANILLFWVDLRGRLTVLAQQALDPKNVASRSNLKASHGILVMAIMQANSRF